MKKLWLIAVIAAALAVTYSCEKKNPINGEGGNTDVPVPTPTPTPTPTPDPAPKAENVKIVVTTSGSTLKFVELTDNGKYIICEQGEGNDLVYSLGDYTINSDKQFVLGQDAVLTYTQNTSTTSFSFRKNDGKVISGDANAVRNTSTSSNLKKLCKTWAITKTRVTITDAIKANADFNGCNLGEIADFVRNQGVEIKHDFKDISVESITVYTSGTTILRYSNGKFDVVECDLSGIDKGDVKYTWPDASAMGYEFTSGTAKVTFEGDNALLSVASNFVKDDKKYDVSVIFVLAEKK